MPIPEVFGDSGLIKPGGVIDAAASVYGGINPIFGNIYAGVKNAAAMKAQEQLADDFAAKNETLFNTTYNRDYLDTNTASATLERLRKRMQESNATIDKQAATTGATNENVLAAKSKETEKFNEGAAQIAAQGTAAQDQAIGRYQAGAGKAFDAQNNVLGAKVQAAQTQAANSGSTLRTILGAMPTGVLDAVTPVQESGVLAGRAPNAPIIEPNMTVLNSKPAFASASSNPINSAVLAPVNTTPINGAGLTTSGLTYEMFPTNFGQPGQTR